MITPAANLIDALGCTSPSVLRAGIFFVLLLIASITDLRERTIPDWVCILLAGLGLIPFSPARLGGILVALPLLIAAMGREGCMGGGDIKLTAAVGPVLGFVPAMVGLILGLIAAVFFYVGACIVHKVRKERAPAARDSTLPLAPFLSAGFFTAYLIQIGGLSL